MTRWLIAASFAATVFAQDFRATISGQVTDRSGAAIPHATVTSTRIDNDEATRAITNSDGYYTLSYLTPGSFIIEVDAPGFNKLTRKGIHLLVADKLDLPLTLEVGESRTTVTVTAEAELIHTGDASGGTSFDSLQVSEYALNGRQVYMLMGLATGVLFTQEDFGATGFSGTRGWDTNGSYTMNGGVQGTNQFLLNGAPISITGSFQLAPNVDAIQEFKVMTNTYDAQFGRTGGGTVNTTLKSGSNAWHGTAFDYIRNSVLDSNVTQNKRNGFGRGKHITHQFGGTVGGAIRRDKDFVFLSFEGYREIVPFPVVTDSPPLLIRDGQHFSTYKINIFDPLTNRTCVAGTDTAKGVSCYGTYIRNPFPNNSIPLNRISPVARKILDLWPLPNLAGQTQNFLASNNTGRYRYDQPMGRWDHTIDQNNRVYAIVTFQHGHEFRNQNGFAPPAQTGNIVSERTDQNYIADWTHVVSSRSILDIRLSFGRFTSYFPDGLNDFGFNADQLGMRLPHAPTVQRATAPHFNLDLYSGIIGNTYTWSTQNQWSFSPSLTQSRGKHTVRFGGEFAYAGLGNGGPARANGEFTFNRTWTQQYSDRGRDRYDGSGVADLLLGLPASGFVDWNDTYYRTFPYAAVYVQDDWKLRRNLTLNLGLRYDVQFPFVERWNRVSNGFDFNTVSPLSDQILARWRELKAQYDSNPANSKYPYPDPPKAIYGGKSFIGPHDSRRTYNTDWTDIQPRVGVAWQFLPKSVLRAGFGMFYRTATQGGYTDGFNQRTNYVKSFDGGILPSASVTGPYSLSNPFPDGIIANGNSQGMLTNIGRSVSFDGRQRLIPRTYQYSFGLQRQLRWNALIDVSYVGSQTVHDTMAAQLDYLPYDIYLRGQRDNKFLNRKIPNPFFGILPITADFGTPEIAAQELFRPYPEFNGITESSNPWARYRYDALQLRLEKRFSGNRKSGALTLIFGYTFSKSFEANHRLNDWNLQEPPIHELSNYDKPQNIAFSGVWDLPFGSHRHYMRDSNRVVRSVVSGWNVNWIFTYNSGFPVAKPNALFTCDSYLPPDGRQTADHWFNNDTKCYKDRPAYTPRSTEDRFAWIRNPAIPTVNLTLARTFQATERIKLQMRGEAFNATNTPLFGSPTTDFKDPRFGLLPLSQRNFPRLIQIAAKLLF